MGEDGRGLERMGEDSIGYYRIGWDFAGLLCSGPLASSCVLCPASAILSPSHPLTLSYFLLASSASSSLIRSACHLMMVSISCILRSCSAR